MYLVLTVASILSVFPLYYMFCASTNRSIDVIAGKLIPGTYLMENFKSLIAQQNLRLALWNSFRNATVLTVLCLLVCSIAGYGFEIYHDKAKDAVMGVRDFAFKIKSSPFCKGSIWQNGEFSY